MLDEWEVSSYVIIPLSHDASDQNYWLRMGDMYQCFMKENFDKCFYSSSSCLGKSTNLCRKCSTNLSGGGGGGGGDGSGVRGRILGIIGQNPSVSKSHWLHLLGFLYHFEA